MLIGSLVLAIAAFIPPWLFDWLWAIPLCLVLQAGWLLPFVISSIVLRRRSLWFLLEVPLTFFWLLPAMLFGCAWGPYACV
jgi:hypothetical protein